MKGFFMKVLLINGSPHKNGCTNRALLEVSSALHSNEIDTEIVWIGNGSIHGCIDCRACKTTHRCAFDDGVNEISAKVAECDGLIVGSPVYYASPNGSVYSLLDRLFGICPKLAHKPAAAVVSARRGGTTAALDGLNKYFMIRQMPVVSSTYWNMVHGNSPEEVEQDAEGLQSMRNLGKNMAWLLKCIEAGKSLGINAPTPDSGERTNFIR